jgi:Zn finger protein HypA/HybF involved in hydrogenase expression
MEDEEVELQCKDCGQVFSAFLRKIAEHNGKITCPGCGKSFQADSGNDGLARSSRGKLGKG